MTKDSIEEGEGNNVPTLSERSIWKFYQWAAVIFPVTLMLSHWSIFYVFSQNTQEVMHYPEENEICIAWIYTFLFMVLPAMTLPASYLFRWCNLFRVPFVYFLFINIERCYYGSWFCTNEMIDTHYILIYCIIGIYALELLGLLLRRKVGVLSYIKSFKRFFIGDSRHNERRKNDKV